MIPQVDLFSVHCLEEFEDTQKDISKLTDLVHLHFNLVSSLLALFATIMANQKINKMIECYQFSCHFAVCITTS